VQKTLAQTQMANTVSFTTPVANFWRHRHLIAQLIRRDVVGRYRGSFLGVFWSLFNPLLSLGVYTFAFGVVFKTRWAGSQTGGLLEFSVMLFAGLIVFAIFSECVTRAPSVVLANPNFVKKIVFPLEVLPMMLLGSAVFHATASLLVLIVGIAIVYGSVPWTVVLFPIVLLPIAFLCLGLGWILASLGVFVRDIAQAIGVLTSALLFLSPIFFPLSALPSSIRPWVALNPLAFPIEQAREVLVLGQLPNWTGVVIYSVGGVLIAGAGYWWFQRTKRAFADVI
jgi:lipopolysaccharide transport system permease protein